MDDKVTELAHAMFDILRQNGRDNGECLKFEPDTCPKCHGLSLLRDYGFIHLVVNGSMV